MSDEKKNLFCKKSLCLVLFISLSLLLSSCDLLTSRVVDDDTQRQISFRCAGTTNVVLRDYCQTDSSIKLLLANRNINDIVGLDYEMTGNRGDYSKEHRLSIEIDEVILVELDIPSSIGNPIDISLTPRFLTGRGIEFCAVEMLLFDEIRACPNNVDNI